MQNPFNHPAMVDISLLLARLTLGLYMLLAGWRKITGGLAKFVDGPFSSMSPNWLPESFARPYGYAIPWLEFFGGVLLVIGLFTRYAGGVMTLLLLSIFIAVVNAEGIQGGDKGPFHASILYTSMAFLIAIVGAGRLSLDALYQGGGEMGGKKK